MMGLVGRRGQGSDGGRWGLGKSGGLKPVSLSHC